MCIAISLVYTRLRKCSREQWLGLLPSARKYLLAGTDFQLGTQLARSSQRTDKAKKDISNGERDRCTAQHMPIPDIFGYCFAFLTLALVDAAQSASSAVAADCRGPSTGGGHEME